MTSRLSEKVGSFGTIVAAMGCASCFPAIASLGAAKSASATTPAKVAGAKAGSAAQTKPNVKPTAAPVKRTSTLANLIAAAASEVADE